MSEKKVGKRLLTWVLVLVMTLSLLPLNVLADEIPETDNTPGKVTATKSCTKEPDSNGNYTITLTVQGNPVSSTDTTTTSANADVVLVVDNSGSMETSVGTPCKHKKIASRQKIKLFWERVSLSTLAKSVAPNIMSGNSLVFHSPMCLKSAPVR